MRFGNGKKPGFEVSDFILSDVSGKLYKDIHKSVSGIFTVMEVVIAYPDYQVGISSEKFSDNIVVLCVLV